MKIALFLMFILLSFSNITAQQLQIKLTNISFSGNFSISDISFSNTDSTIVFLKRKRLGNFEMLSSPQISAYNKNRRNFDNGDGIPVYEPIDSGGKYSNPESTENNDCIFCGILQGILEGILIR